MDCTQNCDVVRFSVCLTCIEHLIISLMWKIILKGGSPSGRPVSFFFIVTYQAFHRLCFPLSLRGPVWPSVSRRTTVSSSWWPPTLYPCGFGWTSSSLQQTSTAVIDLLHVWTVRCLSEATERTMHLVIFPCLRVLVWLRSTFRGCFRYLDSGTCG